MAVPPDPFSTYLKRAADLFEAGDIVQAGQIWQAILKKKPDHEIARAGLYKVKLQFDARATQDGLTVHKSAPETLDVRATLGASEKPQDPGLTRLLEQGCTLYDAGHVQDALAKWAQVLAGDPGNSLAKGYIDGARRSLELPVQPFQPFQQEAAALVSAAPSVDRDRLLRDGCTLYDMGQVEDAMRKWEELLAQDPDHALAWTYLRDARKALGLPVEDPPARPEASHPGVGAAQPGDEEKGEQLDRLLREGVQLYDMGMAPEAIEKWRKVLELAPDHADAEAYLAMAKRDLEAQPARPAPKPPVSPERPAWQASGFLPQDTRVPTGSPLPRILLETSAPEPSGPAEPLPPEPVAPPALVSKPQQAREGVNLPELLRRISLPGWMASPVFILTVIASLVILVFGAFYYLRYRKDKALSETVAALKASAVTPVARDAEIANVRQTPGEIQKEAQDALGNDPLVAYFRAAELVRLNPVEAAYSQLLDQAKAGLAQEAAKPASLEDYESQLHAGDLDAAERTLSVLLSQTPEDRNLRLRAARLLGALAEACASKEFWTDAETRLQRGRALLPEDGSWSVKLLLLARIQSMPRKDRAPWIQLLG